MSERLIHFNGINATRGGYHREPLELSRAERLIASKLQGSLSGRASRGPVIRGKRKIFDRANLAKAGWGLILPEGLAPEVREALEPLIEWRRHQASAIKPQRFRELTLHKGELAEELLMRVGLAPGGLDPDTLPYYLLLVGSPEQIPFGFQYRLDCQYAVGRVCFEHPEQYERYARNVVASEQSARPRSEDRLPSAAFFGVANDDDVLSRLCADSLVHPLADLVRDERGDAWSTVEILGHEATKSRLARLLGGDQTPDLLFTGGHGVCFDAGDPRQATTQGSLVCADWPGPRAGDGLVGPEHYFGASDLDPKADLSGVIAFTLACFSGGTPLHDSFHDPRSDPRQIAAVPFVASLPIQLLAAPAGGALAVIGHVDTAFEHSFHWQEAGQQIETYRDVLRELLSGRPVGLATDHFGQRAGAIAALLTGLPAEYLESNREVDESRLAWLWIAQHDADRFVVLGDPAVRLQPAPAAHAGPSEERPS